MKEKKGVVLVCFFSKKPGKAERKGDSPHMNVAEREEGEERDFLFVFFLPQQKRKKSHKTILMYEK